MPINPSVVNDLQQAEHIDGHAVEPEAIHRLGARETLKALALYQRYLEQQLGAHQSMWMASYRGAYGREFWQTELMEGWKVIDISTPLRGQIDYAMEKKLYFEAAKAMGLDPQAEHTIANAGRTRVHTLAQALGNVDWETHWMRERLHSQGAGERMVGVFTLGPITESVFIVDRPIDAPGFDAADADRLLNALTDFPRLHYWLMLERGLVPPATRPFSPKEREVVQQLLTGKKESAIAGELKLTPGVLHNYATELYRVLGVSSRYELAQLWLTAL